MSQFLEKSEQSLKSAKILAQHHYYSSTINRSYYAYFQFAMHILLVKLKKDQVEFYNQARNNSTGTHAWALKLIGNELIKINQDDYKWFQRIIPEFKQVRVRADYFPDTLTPEEGYSSINKAEAIINLLRSTFK